MLEVLLYVAIFLGAMWVLLMIAVGVIIAFGMIKTFREVNVRLDSARKETLLDRQRKQRWNSR